MYLDWAHSDLALAQDQYESTNLTFWQRETANRLAFISKLQREQRLIETIGFVPKSTTFGMNATLPSSSTFGIDPAELKPRTNGFTDEELTTLDE